MFLNSVSFISSILKDISTFYQGKQNSSEVPFFLLKGIPSISAQRKRETFSLKIQQTAKMQEHIQNVWPCQGQPYSLSGSVQKNIVKDCKRQGTIVLLKYAYQFMKQNSNFDDHHINIVWVNHYFFHITKAIHFEKKNNYHGNTDPPNKTQH